MAFNVNVIGILVSFHLSFVVLLTNVMLILLAVK